MRMKLNHPYNLKEFIQKHTKPDMVWSLLGDNETMISGMNDYQVSSQGDLTWVDYDGLYNKVFHSDARAIIIDKLPQNNPGNKVLIITENPLSLFDEIAGNYILTETKLHNSWWNRFFKKSYSVGKNSHIYNGVSIGKNVCIGDNVTIFPNVVIYDNTIIGNNVTIHSNSVIGAAPFSHIQQENKSYINRNSWGNVVIMDNVEIGALCTIDRGITECTIIGEGTKMDNNIHIGHDTWIGSNCYFSAKVGISGYVRIKNNCTFWGRSGVANSLCVAENTTLLADSVITKNVIESGMTLVGYPAEESYKYWRRLALIRKMQ